MFQGADLPGVTAGADPQAYAAAVQAVTVCLTNTFKRPRMSLLLPDTQRVTTQSAKRRVVARLMAPGH
jgi:hypothetical protein